MCVYSVCFTATVCVVVWFSASVCVLFFSFFLYWLARVSVLYCYCYSRKTCPSPPKVAGNLGLRVRASVAYPLSQRKVRFSPPFFWGTGLRKSGPKGQVVRRGSSFTEKSVFAYYYIGVCILRILLFLLHMCPHTPVYVSSYYDTYVSAYCWFTA